MSIPEDLPGKIKISNHDLVCWYEVGVPIYKVTVKATVQRPTELGVLQEYVLKLIACGVRSDKPIGEYLGLDPYYIGTALSSLNNGQYIVSIAGPDGRHSFSATTKGYEVLERTHASLSSDTFDFLVEGVTGAFRSKYAVHLISGRDLKAAGITMYLQVEDANRPSAKMLNDNHAKIVPIYKEWREGATLAPAELIEIDDLADQHLSYSVLNVLVFRCRETQRLLLRSFEGYAEREDYGSLLTQKERSVGGVVPAHFMAKRGEIEQSIILSKVNLDTDAAVKAEEAVLNNMVDVEEASKKESAPQITAKSERIAELERQLAASSGRPIYNYEHRQILEEAIKTTKHSLVIISPWVKRAAADEHLLDLMRAALVRGVNIAIGYGMPPRRGENVDEYIDPEVEEAFTKLHKRKSLGSLYVERLAGTHEKIIVADSEYCVITSFNWLSYKGNHGFRKETGILTTDQKIVHQIKSEVMGRFRDLPTALFI